MCQIIIICNISPFIDFEDFWGGIENGTADGPIGDVYNGDTDFTIGCIYQWYSDIFDVTKAIAKSGVTLVVPQAK